MSNTLSPGTIYTYRWKDRYPERARESHRKAQLKWRAANRDRIRDNQRKWNAKNRKKTNAYRMKQYYKSRYGLTKEEINREIEARNNKCDCCGQQKKLVVDHYSKTSIVRGFICDNCNTTLGKFQDCPDTLQLLVNYAKNRQCPSVLQLLLL